MTSDIDQPQSGSARELIRQAADHLRAGDIESARAFARRALEGNAEVEPDPQLHEVPETRYENVFGLRPPAFAGVIRYRFVVDGLLAWRGF